MPTFADVQQGYHNLWNAADYARPGMSQGAVLNQIDMVINRGVEGRSAYDSAEHATGVPWWWILPIHNRESSLNFNTHLHNGDPLSDYTHHVPPGRPQVGHGPPFTWGESAADALTMRGLNKITSWSIERALYEAEGYNGWGYFGRISSPYIWAWTSIYSGGKVLRDHGPIENVYDPQLGCAAIWKRMVDRGLVKLISAPGAPSDITQANRPYRYSGVITMDGVDYPYASGGIGRGSAPYGGPWEITPDAIGPIGQRLGAIGVADGQIDDPKFPGQPRIGIEIHPGERDDLLRSEGCIVLQPSRYPGFKQKLLADVRQETQYITINPDGHITIGPKVVQPKDPPMPPAPTPTPVPVPTMDIGSIVATLAPTLIGIIPGILSLTPLAGLAPVAQVLANVVTKSQPTGGVTGTPQPNLLKLVADEAYAIAITIDPTLPHTT